MHLVTWNSATGRFNVIRPLTEKEVRDNEKYVPLFAEARNRLCLFRMLQRNYVQWSAYVKGLLSAGFESKRDEQDELNRLLLNYLTTAYTITEHFDVSYRQRYRKEKAKLDEYTAFIGQLCARSPDYAFISDYRGYVQHVGLAVGFYNRSVSETSVKIEVIVRPSELVKQSKDWKKSKLTADSKDIDLVGTITRYNMVVHENYAKFVALTFFPELVPAAEYYRTLTIEAKAQDADARMYFCPKIPDFTTDENGNKKGNLQWVEVPNDLFAELGIKVERTELKR